METLGFNTYRIWGLEKTGTALEAIKIFGEKASCIILAPNSSATPDDVSHLLALGHFATSRACMIVPLSEDVIPASVADAAYRLKLPIYVDARNVRNADEIIRAFGMSVNSLSDMWSKPYYTQYRGKQIDANLISNFSWKYAIAYSFSIGYDSIEPNLTALPSSDLPKVLLNFRTQFCKALGKMSGRLKIASTLIRS